MAGEGPVKGMVAGRIEATAGNEVSSTARLGRKTRIIVAAGLFVLAILPIVLSEFPPSTDLPQHIAQVRLFLDTLKSPGGPYVIQGLAPNNLVYSLILILWSVLPVAYVGPAVLVLIVFLWIAAIFLLAAGKGRSTEAAILASLLVFNQSFYWGFLNFMTGFPVFILWFALTTKAPGHRSWKLYAGLVGTSFLLYGSHALWLAAGGAWLVLIGLLKRIKVKEFLLRLATLIPCGLVALLWYPRLSLARAASGFDVAPHWSPLFDRLSSFVDAAFGGIRGPVEIIVFVFLYGWCGLSVWQNRRRLGGLIDRDMLAVGGFFLSIVIIAPDKFMNTIFFGSRWFPIALIFLLLSLPVPSVRRLSAKAVALTIAAAFFLITAIAWHRYANEDLSGFRESLEHIPPSSRVLGLDLVKSSEIIKGRPFLQLFAYAQVFKGCELNFSFAEHYSGLVAYKTKRQISWTPGLEWFAAKVKKSDFAFFDYVLVNGPEADHKTLSSFRELSPMTLSGRWRLYKVRR
ncbi:MAG: hypothetical protein MUP28_12155 [Candidatus Aminicenantes bacterium]|nr:hypothetical protein [Candidatus Aminicenantes bacterium]